MYHYLTIDKGINIGDDRFIVSKGLIRYTGNPRLFRYGSKNKYDLLIVKIRAVIDAEIYNYHTATLLYRLYDEYFFYKNYRDIKGREVNLPQVQIIEDFIQEIEEKAEKFTKYCKYIQEAKTKLQEMKENRDLFDIDEFNELQNIVNSAGIDFILSIKSNYKPRQLSLSPSYLPDNLIYLIYNNLNLSTLEKKEINKIQKILPNFIIQTISALLNQNKQLSLNYYVPENCMISETERRDIYTCRNILLKHLKVQQEVGYSYSYHKAPSLIYTEDFYKLISSFIPNYQSEVLPLMNTIRKQKQKIKNEVDEVGFTLQEKLKKCSLQYIKYKKLLHRFPSSLSIIHNEAYNKLEYINTFKRYSSFQLKILSGVEVLKSLCEKVPRLWGPDISTSNVV